MNAPSEDVRKVARPQHDAVKEAKIAAKAERVARERRFARINWNAHVVPLLREATKEFRWQLQVEEAPPDACPERPRYVSIR
jgi:hypothetical protein